MTQTGEEREEQGTGTRQKRKNLVLAGKDKKKEGRNGVMIAVSLIKMPDSSVSDRTPALIRFRSEAVYVPLSWNKRLRLQSR